MPVEGAHLAEEDLPVRAGEAVDALPGANDGIVDLQDPGDGLLLQPLPGVPLVDAGPGFQLARGGGAAFIESSVETQPRARGTR